METPYKLNLCKSLKYVSLQNKRKINILSNLVAGVDVEGRLAWAADKVLVKEYLGLVLLALGRH